MKIHMAAQLVTFLVDDRKFVLLKETITKHPDSILAKILVTKSNSEYVLYDATHSTFYIDRDPCAFQYVVDFLRGYGCDPEGIPDSNLRHKVTNDFKYFGLCRDNNLTTDIEQILTSVDECCSIQTNSDDDDREVELTPELLKLFEAIKARHQGVYFDLEPTVKTLIGQNQDIHYDLAYDPAVKELIAQNQDTYPESDTESLNMDSDG